MQPNSRHLMALLDLANGLGLGHLLTAQSCQRDASSETANSTRARSVTETMRIEERQP